MVHQLLSNDKAKVLRSFNYSIITISVLAVFKLVLSFYRLYTFFEGDVLMPREVSINLLTFISLCLVIWINFAIIFLTNDILYQDVYDLSRMDYLTKLPNRRTIIEESTLFFNRMKRDISDFAVIMLDIDDFKKINDKNGHENGDQTLVDIASVLRSTIRKIDFVGRYGGEEFLILLNAKSIEELHVFIKRLTTNIKNNGYSPLQHKITISGGVAHTFNHREYKNVDEMILLADNKMYEAKDKGKDKIIL